ncbi:MAG: DNA/RNA non-specific endonuclease [Victivallaceae bacterium]|nr:DNA/RNA non-specific endonuclease [Victivallaceae bacterium]
MRILIPLVMFSISVVLSAGPYKHDRWVTQPRDLFFEFDAFVVSFDGPDDDDGDGKPDLWGIPEFVAYEIRRSDKKHKLSKRPKWTTDEKLFKAGIAPDDKTYAVPGTHKLPEVKTDFRFVRGHMCPKSTAERVSTKAAIETHTLLNACPQLQSQNNGIWKELEQKCETMADQYGKVWIITGPVFFNKSPSMWLGQNIEKQAAIPDAFFKIIIWQEGDKIIHQAYLIPNILVKPKPIKSYQTTIPRIESLTGLKFLTKLSKP